MHVHPSQHRRTVILVLLQALLVLSLVPWYFVAAFAIMAFDAPGSAWTVGPYLIALPIWIYPVVALVCSVLAWVRFHPREQYRAMLALVAPYAYAVAALFLGLLLPV